MLDITVHILITAYKEVLLFRHSGLSGCAYLNFICGLRFAKPNFFLQCTTMLRKSFNMNGGHPSGSSCSEVFEEETTPLTYGNFSVPFVRVSQTVKRFKPGTTDMVTRKSTAPSQTGSRFVETFADLESRLGIIANKDQVGENSETVQGSNLKMAGMERLPHPNQIFSGKRRRQNVKRPSAPSANDINVHRSQLQRKQQLLVETIPVESMLISRDQLSKDDVLESSNPSVVLETTKQYFLTFGADASLSWTSSRLSSLSSAGLAREGRPSSLPRGAMPWEGLVASVQRQVVCAGREQDEVVAVHTDRKRKMSSSALESPLDHFLCLYQNSLQQSSDDDEDNECHAASFLGIRGSRPGSFSDDSGNMSVSTGNMSVSSAQSATLQSTGMCSGNYFPGLRSPFESAGYSTTVLKDQIVGLTKSAADWSHEFPYQTYETDDNSFIREE